MTRKAKINFISTTIAMAIATLILLAVLSFHGTARGAESHFQPREFACHCCGQIKVDPRLITALEDLREALGNRPIVITSGYRCPKHNQAIGGARYSRHTIGEAVDIKVRGVSPAEVARVAKKVGFTYTKVYSTWTHIDVRRKE